MNTAKYLMLNSEILLASKPCLSFDNRGLLFADSFSFDIRGNSSKAFFADLYFDHMIAVMKLLKMERPILLKKSIFATDLELLLQKNRIYKGFTAKVTIFRNASLGKLVIDNSVSVLVSVNAIDDEYFVSNQKGLKVSVLRNYSLPDYVFVSAHNPVFSHEMLLKSRLDDTQCDDFLITDIIGNITKTIDSAIFFVKEGNLILPERVPADQSKVFNEVIVTAANMLKIPVVYWSVKREDLNDLDEMFVADVRNGISWIMAFGEKRFFHKTSAALIKKINEMVQI